MTIKRPVFTQAWQAFMTVRVPVKEVGRKIGGMVQKNTDLDPKLGGFENACAIRMSYVLNMTGFPIPKGNTYKTVSGADGRQYMYRVIEMMAYLAKTFGKPNKSIRTPKTTDFAGIKGIIVVKGQGWANAVGHITLWDGSKCSDSCHLMSDPDNGPFVPEIGSIMGAAMIKTLFSLLVLIGGVSPSISAQPLPQTSQYSQKTLLKNWALSICLAQAAQDERTAKDAASTAGAYLEFGRQDLSVYDEIRALVAKYGALKYGGSVPSEFNTMKCIDLFHSKELDRLTTKATRTR